MQQQQLDMHLSTCNAIIHVAELGLSHLSQPRSVKQANFHRACFMAGQAVAQLLAHQAVVAAICRRLGTFCCSHPMTACWTAVPSAQTLLLQLLSLNCKCRHYHPAPPQRAVKTERTFEGISLDTPGQSSRQVLQMSRFQLCPTCHQRESNPGPGRHHDTAISILLPLLTGDSRYHFCTWAPPSRYQLTYNEFLS